MDIKCVWYYILCFIHAVQNLRIVRFHDSSFICIERGWNAWWSRVGECKEGWYHSITAKGFFYLWSAIQCQQVLKFYSFQFKECHLWKGTVFTIGSKFWFALSMFKIVFIRCWLWCVCYLNLDICFFSVVIQAKQRLVFCSQFLTATQRQCLHLDQKANRNKALIR